MTIGERVTLAPYTSLGVGGPARFFIEAARAEELTQAQAFARERGLPLKVLGAGTNVLVPDAGIEAVVVRLGGAAHAFAAGAAGDVELTAEAGASWDVLVRAAAEQGLWGIENLAGIPGSAGGALVQNIGAYGAEFARVFAWAEVFDGARRTQMRITGAQAALAYRTSIFKHRRELAIVRIALHLTPVGTPNLLYADLARAQQAGTPLASPHEIGACVRAIRKGKFPAHGCAGSFFKNPVVAREMLAELRGRYPELPAYATGAHESVKIPLAWLLDRGLGLAGYAKGPVRLFERQPLVIVASRGARAADVEALAQEVEARVQKEFNITLEREVETFA